jgi:hypothetical protein
MNRFAILYLGLTWVQLSCLLQFCQIPAAVAFFGVAGNDAQCFQAFETGGDGWLLRGSFFEFELGGNLFDRPFAALGA